LQAELQRLQQVLELISLDGCQTNALAAHFGEQRQQPCGHCSWCTKGASRIPQRQVSRIDDAIWQQVENLKDEQPAMATNPRMLTRLLCGITSPRLSRNKMTGHSLFGSLEHVPFAEVLSKAVQSMDVGNAVSEDPQLTQ